MTSCPSVAALRVGSVSFLNARPLIFGLDRQADIDLSLHVPSRLLDGLAGGRLDVALLPVIDYQRQSGLRIVPSGGIGSDGETLTVRIFSSVPIERIDTLACDADSHTSVALARVLLAQRFGIRPALVELKTGQSPGHGTAVLLIGDKVVTQAPTDLPHQLDLGAAWRKMTGLPFVFAVWTSRAGVDLRDLPDRLQRARVEGLAAVEEIVARHAVPIGWPAGLARDYLTRHLCFDIGPRQLQAITLFHELAARHGLTEAPRPLEMY